MPEKTKIAIHIFVYFLTVLALVGLIPFIVNDYILAAIYAGFIVAFATLKKQRGDWIFIAVGFIALFFGENFFISTGVETFNRTSLFDIMPLWLPLLWSFIFLVMKRVFWIVYSYINPDK